MNITSSGSGPVSCFGASGVEHSGLTTSVSEIRRSDIYLILVSLFIISSWLVVYLLFTKECGLKKIHDMGNLVLQKDELGL